MPYHMEFDRQNRILRAVLSGVIDDPGLIECWFAAQRAADQLDPKAAVADFSEVTAFHVATATLHQLASGPPVLRDLTRPRVIVAPKAELYGLSRMFQVLTDGTRPHLHVVTTLPQVSGVLGIDAIRFEPIENAA